MLSKFESNQVFTDAEAWLLFRIAAFAEAIGWTMLIIGILCEQYFHTRVPVVLAGRTHGVVFLTYAVAALGLYPNLGWSRKRALVAVLASAPPYGSLLFERWANFMRQNEQARTYYHFAAYTWCSTLAS